MTTDTYRLSIHVKSVEKYGRSTGARRVVHLVTDLNDEGWSLCGHRVSELVGKPAVVKVFCKEAPVSASTDTCYHCLRNAQ